MHNDSLDDNLIKKDLKHIFSDITKAGYSNSVLHTKGYIIAKKTNLIRVRIVLDQYENAVISIVPIGLKEIIFNIFFLLLFVLIGGLFLIIAIGYILISTISFLIFLPKIRAFKTEIEHIIK